MGSKGRILVVDDDRFARELLVEILREEGHAVTALVDPRDALSILKGGRFDLLITDLVLPHVSGLQLLETARGCPRPVDVVVVTGHATVRDAVAALKAGAFDYITKPVQVEELLLTVGRALAQRRLLDENNELKSTVALFQRCQAIAATLERPRVERLAVEAFLEELHGTAGAFVGSGEDGLPELRATHGLKSDVAGELLSMAESAEGSTVEFKKVAADVEGLKEILGPAILARVSGGAVFVARAAGKEQFGLEDRVKLDFLAKHVELALENSKKLTEARAMAFVDDLTDLYNSRYLDHVLGKEIDQATRLGQALSVVFLDLDHFKRVNDTHGHLVGSRLLIEVADIIKRCVREGDIVVRYGGDEYTAILPDTDSVGARAVGERIRASIEETVFLSREDVNLHLTASIGVATVPEDAKDKTEVLRLADTAMYYAKEKNRNAVYSAKDLLNVAGSPAGVDKRH